MKNSKFPAVIYVSLDEENNPLAWGTIAESDDGKVATYRLQEVFDKRESAEVRREGTKIWFKPS